MTPARASSHSRSVRSGSRAVERMAERYGVAGRPEEEVSEGIPPMSPGSAVDPVEERSELEKLNEMAAAWSKGEQEKTAASTPQDADAGL